MHSIPDRKGPKRNYLWKQEAGYAAAFIAVLCLFNLVFIRVCLTASNPLEAYVGADFLFEDNDRSLQFSIILSVVFSLTAWAFFQWGRLEKKTNRIGKIKRQKSDRVNRKWAQLKKKASDEIWTSSLVFISVLPIVLYSFRMTIGRSHELVSLVYWFNQTYKLASDKSISKEYIRDMMQINYHVVYLVIPTIVTIFFTRILYRYALILRKGRAIMQRLSQSIPIPTGDLRDIKESWRIPNRRMQRWQYLRANGKIYIAVGGASCIFIIALWGAMFHTWMTFVHDIGLYIWYINHIGKISLSEQLHCMNYDARIPDNDFLCFIFIYIHPISAVFYGLIAVFSSVMLRRSKRAAAQIEYFPPVILTDLPDEEVLVRGAEQPAAISKTLLRATLSSQETKGEQLVRPTQE